MQEVTRILSADCVCSSKTEFVHDLHRHIITGDLNIVDDVKLRSLMEKGTKFRIPCILPWIVVKNTRNIESAFIGTLFQCRNCQG